MILSLFDNRLKGQVQSDGCSVQKLSPGENISSMKSGLLCPPATGSLYFENHSTTRLKTLLETRLCLLVPWWRCCILPGAAAMSPFLSILLLRRLVLRLTPVSFPLCVQLAGTGRCWGPVWGHEVRVSFVPACCSPALLGGCGGRRGLGLIRLLLGLSSCALPSWQLAIFF